MPAIRVSRQAGLDAAEEATPAATAGETPPTSDAQAIARSIAALRDRLTVSTEQSNLATRQEVHILQAIIRDFEEKVSSGRTVQLAKQTWSSYSPADQRGEKLTTLSQLEALILEYGKSPYAQET